MTEPSPSRPGSSAAGFAVHASPVLPSPRPSVASRASRSSLGQERDRQEHAEPPSSPQPTGRPPFEPLFSLVTTSSHATHHQTTQHPILHYVFADDDPELLMEALAQHHHNGTEADGSRNDQGNPRERAVILDLVPVDHGPGYRVARACSLSPDWAVVSATIGRMGDINGNLVAAQSDGQGALILKIEGVSVESSSAPLAKTPTPEGEPQSSAGSGTRPPHPQQIMSDYSALLAEFDKRMSVLRQVIEAGEITQRPVPTRGDGSDEQLAT